MHSNHATQLRKFKKGLNTPLPSAQNTLSKLNLSSIDLQLYCEEILGKMVPAIDALIKDACAKQNKMSSVKVLRPQLPELKIWGFKKFWEKHREFLIQNFAVAFNDSAEDFARTRHVILKDSQQTDNLYNALKGKYPNL